MKELTSFQRDVLYALSSEEQMNGSDIRRELQEYYGLNVNNGQLYPNLDKLAENGLIEKIETDSRSNYYMRTEKAEELIWNRRGWEDEQLENFDF